MSTGCRLSTVRGYGHPKRRPCPRVSKMTPVSTGRVGHPCNCIVRYPCPGLQPVDTGSVYRSSFTCNGLSASSQSHLLSHFTYCYKSTYSLAEFQIIILWNATFVCYSFLTSIKNLTRCILVSVSCFVLFNLVCQ